MHFRILKCLLPLTMLSCPFLLLTSSRTISFSHRVPFPKALRSPARLVDLLLMHHHASLGRYRLTQNYSMLIPTPFDLPLFRLSCPSLWVAQRLAKGWNLNELIESGELRALRIESTIIATNRWHFPQWRFEYTILRVCEDQLTLASDEHLA